MRIILIAAFFLLPISAVAAHHPVHAKAGLNVHEMHKMQIYTICPIRASITGA
jgi:hypothetical protein